MLRHLFLDFGQRLSTILARADLQNQCDVSRHSIGNRSWLQPSTGKTSGDLQSIGCRMRKQVVGELEDLVFAAAGQKLRDRFWRELGAGGLVSSQLPELGVDDAQVRPRDP